MRYYRDNCLVDALRALGFKVPYSQDGPFYVLKDGRKMLAPLEQLVNNLRRTLMYELVAV